MKIKGLALLILLNFVVASGTDSYNRSSLEEKYPEYGKDFVMFTLPNGTNVVGYLNRPDMRPRFQNPDVDEEVTFTLFTRKEPKGVLISTQEILRQSSFNPKKETKFITHGWMSSGTADTCIRIKDNFLKKYDYNVFIMNWEDIAGNLFYYIPMKSTTRVGEYYATFLNYLVDKMKVDPKSIHLIGHSLGAHVSGFAARAVKSGMIKRITGLDPALPGFGLLEGTVPGGRLRDTDADFVDVIHTCAGFLGINSPIGHADFYPNGGSPPQPGCGSILEMVEACSHGMSWKLFAQSILQENDFISYRCESFEDYILGECNDDPTPMGYSATSKARGSYYLQTE